MESLYNPPSNFVYHFNLVILSCFKANHLEAEFFKTQNFQAKVND